MSHMDICHRSPLCALNLTYERINDVACVSSAIFLSVSVSQLWIFLVEQWYFVHNFGVCLGILVPAGCYKSAYPQWAKACQFC